MLACLFINMSYVYRCLSIVIYIDSCEHAVKWTTDLGLSLKIAM